MSCPRSPPSPVARSIAASCPCPQRHWSAPRTPTSPPATELESEISAIWCRIFGVQALSVADNFFQELGGHSLLAAQMVTALRGRTVGYSKQVTVRDAYQFPTVRALANHLEAYAPLPTMGPDELRAVGSGPAERVPPKTSRDVFASQSPLTRLATGTLQAVSTYLLYGLLSIPFVLLFLVAKDWILGRASAQDLARTLIALTFLTWPVFLVVSIVAKWVLVGRYRAGSFPLWGFYHYRVWLAGRFAALSGSGALVGTPLLPLYLRLMGARIGRRCTLDTGQFGAWDLLQIGDDTSIGADTQLLGYTVSGGMLHIGPIHVGKGCFIGNHAVLGIHSSMADGARLDDQSLLPSAQHIPAGQSYRGSPAAPAPVPLTVDRLQARPPQHPLLFGFLHLALMELFAVIGLLPLLPMLALGLYLFAAFQTLTTLQITGLALLSAPVGVVLSCLTILILKKLVLRTLAPGVYPVHSIRYLRKWLSDGIMRMSRSSLLPLYTTLYLPAYLRLLGAKIGRRAELSTIWYFAPELTEIAEESFFADGSIVGGKRVFGGFFEVGKTRIGRRSFVGNSAIVPPGGSLGDGCLLGVNSIPPVQAGMQGTSTPDHTEWLGSPAFALPHRPKVGNFDEHVTFRPTKKLYAQRAVIDGMRVLIPGYVGLCTGWLGIYALHVVHERHGVSGLFALGPAIFLALALLVTLFVVLLKRVLMGTFRPVIKPLWSVYVWVNELVNGAYESLMSPAIAPFLGTPFVAIFLRWIGCHIGKNCYIETTLFSEFDLVHIGDHVALNHGAVIQNHLFEDRVMKSSSLHIGDNTSVGNMAVVLYDSVMQEGASLGPLSLLMKGETLAAHTHWHGIPAAHIEPPRDTSRRPLNPTPDCG